MSSEHAPDRTTVELCTEMQALLLATTMDELHSGLMRSFERLRVAGYSRFDFARAGDVKSSVRIRQVADLSGALSGVSTTKVGADVRRAFPAWLVTWVLMRKQPFWLGRYTRFIPYSSQLILQATAPPGRPRLRDLLVVTLPGQARSEGLMVGLQREAKLAEANQLLTIASTYLLKHFTVSGGSFEPVPAEAARASVALNDRQLECLQWLVAGKSLEEVSMITGLSYSNVRYHVAQAKKHAGFASLQQLLAFAAVEYGLSPMGPDDTAARLERLSAEP